MHQKQYQSGCWTDTKDSDDAVNSGHWIQPLYFCSGNMFAFPLVQFHSQWVLLLPVTFFAKGTENVLRIQGSNNGAPHSTRLLWNNIKYICYYNKVQEIVCTIVIILSLQQYNFSRLEILTSEASLSKQWIIGGIILLRGNKWGPLIGCLFLKNVILNLFCVYLEDVLHVQVCSTKQQCIVSLVCTFWLTSLQYQRKET